MYGLYEAVRLGVASKGSLAEPFPGGGERMFRCIPLVCANSKQGYAEDALRLDTVSRSVAFRRLVQG